jgi:hypothetical protein
VTCTQTGTAAIAATVRVGSHTLRLGRASAAVTAGRARAVQLRIPAATWRRLAHGHHYRATVQLRLGQAVVGRATARVRR